jgi:hypothetical protein
MSLINDALKQAKATQPALTSVASGPALRPVEPARRSRGTGFLLPAVILVVLVLALILLWQWFHGGADLQVRAKTIPSAELVAATPTPAPVAAVPAIVPTTPAPAISTPAPVPASAETVKVADASATVPAVTPAVAVEPAKPQPPTYKVQSIFYSPKKPSAVINGKLVYLGQRVSGASVVEITADSVTLVTSGGQTNVLELP